MRRVVVAAFVLLLCSAGSAQAAGPTAIGVDSAGAVYVGFANGGQIKRYQGTDGAALSSWGTPGSSAGQLGGVVAIDVAPGNAGNVWILDTNRRVQEFSRAGQYLRGIQLASCDVGVSPNVLLRGGLDVTNDDVFVMHPCASTALRLRKSDLQTMNTGSVAGGKGVSAQLYNSAPEPTRRTYIAQPGANQATKLQPWFSTDGAVSTPSPTDVFVDAFGVLFTTDTANDRIHLYDSNASEFRWLGGSGSDPGKLSYPAALDVFEQYSDLAGNVFVADYGNSRIQRWNPYGYTFWAVPADDAAGPPPPPPVQTPVNQTQPVISGTPQPGNTLTCSPGTWSNSPTSYAFQFKRDATVVDNDSSYDVTAADVGHVMTCTVTASNSAGSASATSNPVTVTAAPCASNRVGVTINHGATFTNNTAVTVTAHEPDGVLGIWLANDGAFDVGNHASPVSCTDEYNWILQSGGNERLPKTVYVRFGDSTVTYTDDIILDTTAPVIRSASLRGRSLKVVARDSTAGVGKVQIAAAKVGPYRTVRYAKRITVAARATARWVRAIDRAGNYSRWKKVSRR